MCTPPYGARTTASLIVTRGSRPLEPFGFAVRELNGGDVVREHGTGRPNDAAIPEVPCQHTAQTTHNGTTTIEMARRTVRPAHSGSVRVSPGRNGSIAVLAGCAVLVRAVRNRNRSAVQVLLGAALLGFGLRQRRSEGGGPAAGEDERGEPDTGTKELADGARTARERNDVLHRDETNPRGVTGEPDVEAATEPDEGDIQFTTEGEEPRRKPALDEEVRTDPRNVAEAGESVEIDLSEASMADEEAAGGESESATGATGDADVAESDPDDGDEATDTDDDAA